MSNLILSINDQQYNIRFFSLHIPKKKNTIAKIHILLPYQNIETEKKRREPLLYIYDKSMLVENHMTDKNNNDRKVTLFNSY